MKAKLIFDVCAFGVFFSIVSPRDVLSLATGSDERAECLDGAAFGEMRI